MLISNSTWRLHVVILNMFDYKGISPSFRSSALVPRASFLRSALPFIRWWLLDWLYMVPFDIKKRLENYLEVQKISKMCDPLVPMIYRVHTMCSRFYNSKNLKNMWSPWYIWFIVHTICSRFYSSKNLKNVWPWYIWFLVYIRYATVFTAQKISKMCDPLGT